MDQALKQRLVGATVLIVLAIILLPMLLSGQPDSPTESRRIELPDKPPELSVDKRRFPIGEHDDRQPSRVPETIQPSSAGTGSGTREVTPVDLAQTGAAGAETDKAADIPRELAASPATEAAPPEPEPEPEPEPGPRPESSPEQAPVTASASSAQGRYLVQVASFSNAGSAANIADTLTGMGLPVLVDYVTTEAGRLQRVRVGPFDDTAQANAAIQRIQALNLDLQPRVVDLRPGENAPVTEPSDPLVRWVVQAGVFQQQENADQMVDKLRKAGFSAFAESVSSTSGTVVKVKIGPVLERRRAEEIDVALERQLGIDGLVMSVD